MRAVQLTEPVAHHAEGPVWIDGLHWVDLLAGDVLRLHPDGAIERRHIGSIVAVIRPRTGGGFAYALERGFALEDATGHLITLPDLWSDPMLRMNDGGCAPDGSFLCGSMAYDAASGAGSLYRLAPDGHASRVLSGVTISNGLEWSPDGALAYYVDSVTGRVDVFDYDGGTLANRRPFASIAEGAPDGLTVDSEGGVWVALWGGSAVHRYDPAGVLTAVVSVDARQVTSCAFGGAALDELFITTSREGLDDDDDPLAGSVFVVRPGVTGVPVRAYGG